MPQEHDLSPAGQMLFSEVKELKIEFRELAKELRIVTETLIAIKTQDVATELMKLRETELKDVKSRLTALEKSKLQIVTVGMFLWGLLGAGIAILEIYNKIRGK